MKKLRLLILLVVPLLGLLSCTKEMPVPVVKATFPATAPISDQLTTINQTGTKLIRTSPVFAESLDPVANEMGEWLEYAGMAMDTAAYFLNIAPEAMVSTEPVVSPASEGDVTVYKYFIFTWSATGGEETKYVAYQVVKGAETTAHQVLLSDSENGSYTQIISATLENSDLENGTMQLSFSGNLGSPDYEYEWTDHGSEKVSWKVIDHTAGEMTEVENVINGDNTSTLKVSDPNLSFSANSNEEGLKGTYERYDAQGEVTESGTWDLLREDLSVVTLSIIDLYGPVTQIRDRLGEVGQTEEAANLAWMHFGGTIVPALEKYVPYYSPPEDAETSNEPIEGERWSLVYYWDNLAYQISTTPETYYHIVYTKNGEAWDTLCYAEDSKTMRSAEMYFVKDTLDVWDFTSHFQLSTAQDGVSDELHLVVPIYQETPPGWQDYFLVFDPETLATSNWQQVFNNSFGGFNWRVGNWTANCETGYWEEWGFGPHEIKATYTWPVK